MFNPENLPAPDEMGFFFHPDIPGEDESDDVKALCLALGFDATAVAMEDDAPELADEWAEAEDMTAPTRWTPTPPAGEGWMLVAKYDTEDGPAAMFVRPNAKSEPTARLFAQVGSTDGLCPGDDKGEKT